MSAICRLLRRVSWPGIIRHKPYSCARFMHPSFSVQSKPIEPLLQDKIGDDQFSEMMDDRTNASSRSLGVDASQFEEVKPKLAEKDTKPINESEESSVDSSGNSKDDVPADALNKSSQVGTDNRKRQIKSAADATVAESSGDKSNGTVLNATNTMISQRKRPAVSYFIDTQDIYAELRAAGLSTGQAELLMCTIQELINELVVTCKERAVPVSAAANETYLFDAASSEVRNEISNSRQLQATSYRSGLARLQRDVEILEHTATEMTNLLKSDMDIEVHERKNSARAEENVIQLKIQDLSNKISTRLNSELKSEIENLRWQITRRSLTAIGLVAALFIWITQTTSSKKTAMSQERQRNTSGKPVPVHILAPSMSAGDDGSYDGNSQPHVDDINSISNSVQEPSVNATSFTEISDSANLESSTAGHSPSSSN